MECPTHLTHKFKFQELEVGKGSNQQPYFKALLFFYKKPGLSHDFFHEHWKSVHADLTMRAGKAGANIVRYVQVDCALFPFMYTLKSLMWL